MGRFEERWPAVGARCRESIRQKFCVDSQPTPAALQCFETFKRVQHRYDICCFKHYKGRRGCAFQWHNLIKRKCGGCCWKQWGQAQEVISQVKLGWLMCTCKDVRNCRTIVFCHSLSIFSVLDVHDKPVSCLRMSSCGKMLATGGDRYIRVFHNVAEYFSDVVVLEEAFKEAREETKKRRLQEQLDEAKKLLSSFSF